ncbi:MAG: hypothetical protein IT455_04110 [Planctomycetes bacterium]|nr:hypothetical protein [Planctomycetota bacterium]
MRWVVVGLLLAWLLGRGLGLFGAGPEATQPSPDAVAGTVVALPPPPGAPPAPLGETGANGGATTSTSSTVVAAQPAVETTVVANAPPAPSRGSAPDALPAVDADRFASNLSLLGTRIERGELANALAALAHLRSLPLDGAQQTALEGPAMALEQAVAAASASVLQGLCRGEVLAARDQVARLFGDGPQLLPFVREALRPWLLDGDLLRPLAAAAGDVALPSPLPLPRHRELRVRWRGATVVARVVDSRSDQVTVSVRSERGQSFPTVAVVVCEPVAVTTDEAIEMALAALHGNDPVTARLWLVVARQRGDGTLPPRGELAAAALRS